MPRNFDSPLTILNGCLSPTGVLNPDDAPLRLDVWIFQGDAACVAVQHNFPNSGKWTAHPNLKENHTGAMFKPGPATAMALLVYTTAGQTKKKTFQWNQDITLV